MNLDRLSAFRIFVIASKERLYDLWIKGQTEATL